MAMVGASLVPVMVTVMVRSFDEVVDKPFASVTSKR